MTTLADTFRQLHVPGTPVLIANAWGTRGVPDSSRAAGPL